MATITGINSLLNRLNKISNIELEDTMNEAVKVVHAQAKMLALPKTGTLRSSIHMETKKNGKKLIGRVYTNLQYAPYVEFGTGSTGNGTYPYEVDGVSLTYRSTPWVYTPDGGETFYHTNGRVARPYMYPALKNNEKYIKQLFKKGLKEKLAKNCKGD